MKKIINTIKIPIATFSSYYLLHKQIQSQKSIEINQNFFPSELLIYLILYLFLPFKKSSQNKGEDLLR